MPATKINDRLWSWADDLDYKTIEQAKQTARLPIIEGHVALMPDAHLGYGATVGSVIVTNGAVVPSAAGVDLGCGMSATRTDLTVEDLPDDFDLFLDTLSRVVPAGVGMGHQHLPEPGLGGRGNVEQFRRLASHREHAAATWMHRNRPRTDLVDGLGKRAMDQLGSLGSGNHFVEVSEDTEGNVVIVLHSGSRGVGNKLATRHIRDAKDAFADLLEALGEDPDEYPKDLAWLVEHTPEFDHYIEDMLWAQDYAAENRRLMLDGILQGLALFLDRDVESSLIASCHHNYCEREKTPDGRPVWVTRKGAIRAGEGDLGIIPGSMGTSTFLVRGLGNEDSWQSSSHGAGRRMSRTQAKKTLDMDEFKEQMRGRAWQHHSAQNLLDEAPGAYKDIHDVMAKQADLTDIVDEFTAVLNYKGTK